MCTYKSVILHRAAADADHGDSNIETSHTVNTETTRGDSLVPGGERHECAEERGEKGTGFDSRPWTCCSSF